MQAKSRRYSKKGRFGMFYMRQMFMKMACLQSLFKANRQDFMALVWIYHYGYSFLVSYNSGGLK